MAFLFFDTSALAKAYIDETGSAWVKSLLDPAANNAIYHANVTNVELTSAIVRRLKGAMLTSAEAAAALSQFRNDRQQRFLKIDVTDPIVRHAETLAEKHALRAYDAIQLAAAMHLAKNLNAINSSSPILISADTELNDAASAEGIAVDDPNTHP